jgi:hypothetical protein
LVTLAGVLSALQDTAIATALRQSFWVYPIVNAGHIVGLALLFGAIVPLDLRLIGLWRRIPIGAMTRFLMPVAIAGLVLAVPTGALMFAVRATEYAGVPFFQIKLVLIAVALANALLLRMTTAWAVWRDGGLQDTTPRLQVAGVLSIALWLAIIFAGRMIGYR